MKHIIIVLTCSILLGSITYTKAQSGFVNKYNFGLDGLAFSDMIFQESDNSLVLYGYGIDTAINQNYGFLMAKIDTNGNLVNYVVHYLDIGQATGYTPTRDIIRTADGGFAAVGCSFFVNEGVFLKTDQDFSLETLKIYPNLDSLYLYDIQYIQPTPDGYFLGGSGGYLDGSVIPFIYKIDLDGNLTWQKKYRQSLAQNVGNDLLRLSDNEYVIAGVTAPLFSGNNTNPYFQGWLIGIDTSGTVLWEWESDTNSVKFGLTEILKDGNNGWIAVDNNAEYGNNAYKYKFFGGMLKLNEQKEVVWETPLGVGQRWNADGGLEDIAPTIDGNWVGVGCLISDSLNARTAWMVAVSATGDSLWARTDTLMFNNNIRYRCELNAVVVLPSGSIIAAGRAEIGKYLGLLVKADPRGCIEPDCHPYSISGADTPNDITFHIGPNPTSGLLQVHTGSSIAFSAELYDGAGRVLAARTVMQSGDTLDISDVPSGQYFVRIKTAGSSTVVHNVIRI